MKMNMKMWYVPICVLLLTATSCQKEVSENTSANTNQTANARAGVQPPADGFIPNSVNVRGIAITFNSSISQANRQQIINQINNACSDLIKNFNIALADILKRWAEVSIQAAGGPVIVQNLAHGHKLIIRADSSGFHFLYSTLIKFGRGG